MERRSKSFRALGAAQPIKKEIDDTLIKLQLEKRQFLAFERQQTYLKDVFDKKKKQLNELKHSQFQTKNQLSKTSQNANFINNVDRSYQHTKNNLNQLRSTIEIRRKQVQKYKKLNNKLNEDLVQMNSKVQTMFNNVINKQQESEKLKQTLIEFRQLNHKNTVEFQKSHFNLTRSQFDVENNRKKNQVIQKTFLGEQLKKSKALAYQNLSEMLKNSGIYHDEGQGDIMTESVPLAKHRVSALIHQNKQKLKISDNYRKFGQGLDEMFSIMKQYKGRDDLQFIASQFVAKERQIQNLQQYVSKLQGNISMQQKKLAKIIEQDQILKTELSFKNQNQIDKHYQGLNMKVNQQIQVLKVEQQQMTQWMNKVGQILTPLLTGQDTFNRTNAIKCLGQIEVKIGINKSAKFKSSPNKNYPSPSYQLNDKNTQQLMTYEKMKQFAQEYIQIKIV